MNNLDVCHLCPYYKINCICSLDGQFHAPAETHEPQCTIRVDYENHKKQKGNS